MKRIIYSIYVDIPAKEHFGESTNRHDSVAKANVTIDAFKEHYDRLITSKKDYADTLGVTFKMYEYDEQYKTFEKNFTKDFPEFTGYEVINFYKIHILNELAKDYDEILYLDFDAIPMTDDNFFEVWDLSKGICVLNNTASVVTNLNINHSIRSPTAKYFNCQAMLIDSGYDHRNSVINTGIIGARKEDVINLDFFGGFRDTIDLMTRLRFSDNGLYPQNIIDMFRYDNETIFSYKVQVNDVNLQWLDAQWHYFFDWQGYIPVETKIVHAICKDFACVWRRIDA
jgi:hypothetical protein|tara:strand:- start:193 stop:1044 length:852 start_codon:yes stop_codon:yes gene_type:complete